MGVRYNAEKKKIGAYYSTPIFSFRCKCHLCDGWFEIQTDPKVHTQSFMSPVLNSLHRILVMWLFRALVKRMKTGIQKKMAVTLSTARLLRGAVLESFPHRSITDTEAHAVPADPLASLEKTTDAQKGLVKAQDRLESLQEVSEHYNSDPFSLSSKVRKRFREEKKVEKAKKQADDKIKDRYGLPETLSLIEDDAKAAEDAKEQFARGRRELELRETSKRRKLAIEITTIPSSSSRRPAAKRPPAANPITSLRARVLENTARQSNPFGRPKA